jgi:D-glycero-D-manno-heptose 1,7-bisphosphate phosphatase
MNKAIFFDRDGTLIKDKGYIKHEKDVEFYEYTFESLKKLQKHFHLFIVTNQGGISKGLVTKKEVESINSYVLAQLKTNGIIIQELYYCPHQEEDNCMCRKPNTYFIEQAIKKYDLNPSESFVIGDHLSDIQLAINSQTKGIYLLIGHGKKHRHEIQDEILSKINICLNIKYATNLILNEIG